MSDRSLVCKFVTGSRCGTLFSVRANSRADSLELAAALVMTGALLSDGRAQVAAAAAAVCLTVGEIVQRILAYRRFMGADGRHAAPQTVLDLRQC